MEQTSTHDRGTGFPSQAGYQKQHSLLHSIPLDLEFDFLGVVLAFVLDAVGGADGDVESFAGDLDFKRYAVSGKGNGVFGGGMSILPTEKAITSLTR